jgi:5-methylcytosine-specific restriction endonuclease McrBC regulatory subunit McrC
MAETLKHITAFDCLPFDTETATADVIQVFIKSQSKNVFWFSADYNADDDSKLAEYDYRNNNWTAGRFVGEAIFNHNQTDYKITIKPRFGEKMLFRMLEEIFNIRITTSASQTSKSIDWQHYIKRIIAFIWLQKLANANLHGVPRTQIRREYKGQAIKGRLDVRKSMKPLHRSSEVVSIYREKHLDETIAQIIFQAYQILKTDFEIGKINIPDSAKEAINQVHSVVQNKVHISESNYRNIRYKDIYLSWKPLVDLSWDIIKRTQFSLKQDRAKKGFGFFIDMAEVWEQYLRAILKKNLSPYGWRYKNDKQTAYKGYFFQRKLIPDLVFQKENEVAVWDAKYKRMTGKYFDVDRSDFFQIHTYILYLLNHRAVKAGGLFFPISNNPDFEKYRSPSLINEEGMKISFSIDGVELIEEAEEMNPEKKEEEFVSRIIKSIC